MPAHCVCHFWKFKKEQLQAWVEADDAAEPNKKDFGK